MLGNNCDTDLLLACHVDDGLLVLRRHQSMNDEIVEASANTAFAEGCSRSTYRRLFLDISGWIWTVDDVI